MIEISEASLKKLEEEKHRTSVGLPTVFKRNDVPQGLTESMVSSWLTRNVKTAQPRHINWIINAYADLPDTNINMSLSSEMKQLISDEMDRTGVGAKRLFGHPKMPNTMTSGRLTGIMGKRGYGKISPEEWEWLKNTLKESPDKETLVQLTADVASQLQSEIQRTGIGAVSLLKKYEDVIPKGLTASRVNSWSGMRAKSYNPQHLAWILQKYEALPSRDNRPRNDIKPS